MKVEIIALTALACMTLGGCSYVTKDELSQVRAQAQQADATAQQALTNSNEAKEVAAATDERSRRTEVVIDKSFKRSMFK